MRPLLKNSKGVALTIVIVVLIMLTMISAFIMSLGYNRARLIKLGGSSQAVSYYLARGGIVDANWRIHNNYPTGVKDYTDPATTDNYTLDVNGDGVPDTRVTISARAANGLRTVTANNL